MPPRDRATLQRAARALEARLITRTSIPEKVLVQAELGYMRRQLLRDRKSVDVTYPVNPPFAFIRIPAFGPQWRFTLIQGTALAQLNMSPGHVPGTQWPGQTGNFAVAGHRVTAGNPFWSLPSMKDGDLVYIQTRLNNYTYRVTGKTMVAPTDTAVLDPVPGHPRQRPTRRMITLITCDPAWTGTHRVIVTGVLVAAKPR